MCKTLLFSLVSYGDLSVRYLVCSGSIGSVHILYNADGVGVGLGFVILCYIWWGVVLTFVI